MNPIFAKRRAKLLALKALRDKGQTPANTDWLCPKCQQPTTQEVLSATLDVCPHCGHHASIGAYRRLDALLDAGSFHELNAHLSAKTDFPGYSKKLQEIRQKTDLCEALVTGIGQLGGRMVVVAVLDSRFFMGSMGTAVGEKLTRAIEVATKKKYPLIVFSASGGARMQEGILSLMQMAKTSAAIGRFSQSGGLFISVFTHPTTGGVTASFASLGDITLAEPGALIGFAGPRVIAQTIGETLPQGFQRAESVLQHGFVDAIVPRCDMKKTLSQLLLLHSKGGFQ